MREITAACLHEGFKLTKDSDDIRKLQLTLLELLQDDNKTVIQALIDNLNEVISRYCNTHAKNQVQEQLIMKDDDDKNLMAGAVGIMHSKTLQNKISSLDLQGVKGLGTSSKYLPAASRVQKTIDRELLDLKDEKLSASNQYLILPEYSSETVYQELLQKLLIFG